MRVHDDDSIEHTVATLNEHVPPEACELRGAVPDGTHRVLPLP